ncbi:Ribosomal RNA large subunit methyltransferase E [Candidatus Kinetoplastibacterium sorsogonicusi]|uniref:Ribosomal RNA large subunit methyltransferase E n=2 Tax=Candidatus Kinetoplastidibacterium kentomonadis TaxID=1576550 RepID=A0A3Q8EU22_9PROT|nr:Ribosomal RNA large subunit methyltransferase E [Candidatus Kinetoplastibacterium sorsogonicusi]
MLKKNSKKWLLKHINDPYVKLANKEGYRSRAAFKLLEILDIEKIEISDGYIIDLGSSPGSWSQVICKKFINNKHIKNKIIALDLLPMESIDGVDFLQGDFRDKNVEIELSKKIGLNKIKFIFSDMSPNLSGIPTVDNVRIIDIANLVFEFAKKYLSKDGFIVLKTFHGSGFSQIMQLFKLHFKVVVERKPKASRSSSSEVFIVAKFLK